MPGLLEQEPDRVDVDLEAQVKVVLGAARHDAVQAVDDGRGAQGGGEERGDRGRGGEVGLDGDAAGGGDAGGGFGLDWGNKRCEMRDDVGVCEGEGVPMSQRMRRTSGVRGSLRSSPARMFPSQPAAPVMRTVLVATLAGMLGEVKRGGARSEGDGVVGES